MVETEVVLGTDPGIREVLDFHRKATGVDIVIHDEGPEALFIVAKTEGGRVVGSVYIERYPESDAALLHTNCPAHCRPYFRRLASILSPAEVAYAGTLIVSKEFRGGDVVGMGFVKMLGWATSHGIQAMLATSNFKIQTHVYSRLGFRPLGQSYQFGKVLSRDGLPKVGMLVPQVAVLSDHPAKAIQDQFRLFAANCASEHANAKKLEALISASGGDSVLESLKREELARIVVGAVQFDIRAGEALVPGRDVGQKDWIIVLSGEMVVMPECTADGHARRTIPGQILGGQDFGSASQIVVVKDTRFMMLSRSGGKCLSSTIAEKVDEVESRNVSGSYSVHLSERNTEKEIARLEQQAKLFKTLELGMLKSLGLRDGSFVADVGCGTGVMSIVIAREFPKSRIVAIDPNEALISKGREMARRLGLASRLTFSQNYGVRMKSLETSSVDFAYARFLMQHTRQPLDIIREMRRIVKPGGRVCAVDTDDGFVALYPSLPGVDAMMEEAALVQKERGGDRFVGRKLFHFFQLAGLVDVKTHFHALSSHQLPPDTYNQVVYSFREAMLEETGHMDQTRRRLFIDIKKHIRKPSTLATNIVIVAEGTVPPLPSSKL